MQITIQLEDKTPRVSSPEHSAVPEPRFSVQPLGGTRITTQQRCPGMGHREEEHDHKAISSFTSRGAVNHRPRLLRSKKLHTS